MSAHDRLCDKPGTPADRCRVCTYIRKARADERGVLYAQVSDQFPHPTLGVQKVLRILQAQS